MSPDSILEAEDPRSPTKGEVSKTLEMEVEEPQGLENAP